MSPTFPPAVRTGDRVGVAALSGPVDPARLEAGLEALAELGFAPVRARNLAAREDLFAGSDTARLDALHELVDDDSLRAIFFARGGHGVLRLLPHLDWDRLVRRPRAWIGYSDLTPLLDAVARRAGMVTFHGPMVAADLARGLGGEERVSLLAALAGEWPHVLAAPEGAGDDGRAVEGELAGGCLSLLASTIGTPWQLALDDCILLLEDIDEPSYRIDRMLTHLHLSGSLTGVRGAILGNLRGTDEPIDGPSRVPERVRHVLPDLPVLGGLECGHRAPNRTLPLRSRARLDARSGTLTVGLAGGVA
jgi:muramoyltetrapeptide carboxypeptidase